MDDSDNSESKDAIELRTFSPKLEVGAGLGKIGIGLALLLALSLINTWMESQSQGGETGGCLGLIFYALLLAVLGLLYGAGKNIFDLITWSFTTYANPPVRDVPCSSCSHVAKVNVRQYAFFCEKCKEPLQWSPYGNGLDVDPVPAKYQALLEGGTPCFKCRHQNFILERPAWFTCPICKSRVALERIPSQDNYARKARHVGDAPITAARPEAAMYRTCLRCHHSNPRIATLCESCGSPL
jgi:hypothetical protein